MKEDLELIKNVIRHPGRTVEALKDKSFKGLGIVLMIFNIIIAGALYVPCKFWIPVDSLLFWVLSPVVGIALLLFMGGFLGIYYLFSKFLLKEKENIGIRVQSFYFLIVYSVYHLVAAVVILLAVPVHAYGLAILFWDISHFIILFWIAALCVQGIQKLRDEAEFRTVLKVFSSLFIAYCLQMIIFVLVSRQLLFLIFR